MPTSTPSRRPRLRAGSVWYSPFHEGRVWTLVREGPSVWRLISVRAEGQEFVRWMHTRSDRSPRQIIDQFPGPIFQVGTSPRDLDPQWCRESLDMLDVS